MDGAERRYIYQMQFQMMVTGAQWCDFMTFHPEMPDHLKAKVWRVERGFYSGSGLLSTHGNLVFQGDLAGNFNAYSADTGQQVWSYPAQGGIMASPIAYQLDGEQYIAVAQGWGGESSLPFGAISGPLNMFNISRMLVFKLGATASLPGIETQVQLLPPHELAIAAPELVAQGRELYNLYCAVCHGAAGDGDTGS